MTRIVLIGLLGLIACSGEERRTSPAKMQIPRPDLSSVDAEARRLIESRRSRLDQLLDRSVDGAELAQVAGEAGMAYHAQNLAAAARACYELALTQADETFEWNYLLGRLERDHGAIEDAAERFERALQQNPSDAPTLLHLAELMLEMGKPDSAEQLFRKAGDLAAAHYGLGRALAAQGQHASAINHFERALELPEAAPVIHYALALSLRAVNESERAESQLEQYQPSMVSFDDPLSARMAGLARAAENKNAQASRAMAAGQYDAAAALLEQVVAERPNDTQALRNLAISLAFLGRYEEAVERLTHCLAVAPDDALARVQLAAVLAQLDRTDESIEHLEIVVAADPGNEQAAVKLGELLLQRKQLSASKRAFERLPPTADSATRAGAEFGLAQIARMQGKLKQAYDHLGTSIRLQPDLIDARVELVLVSLALGNKDEARRQIDVALSRKPSDLRLRLAEIDLLMREDRLGETVTKIDQLRAELTPSRQTEVDQLLARILSTAADESLRDGPRALQIAQSAVKQAPADPRRAETLAMALAASGDFAQAADLQRELLASLRSAPNSAGQVSLMRRLELNLERYERRQIARFESR